MKSVVLVDGQYLHFALRGLKAKIDYTKLMQFLKNRYAPVLKVLFYTGVDQKSDKQRRFLVLLQKLGYEVHSRPIQKVGDALLLKGLDVELATDILIWADSCDRIVLLSGDADFAPSVAALAKKGVIAEVLAFHFIFSQRLRQASQEFTDLTDVMAELTLQSGPATVQHESKALSNESTLWHLKGVEPERVKDLRAAWNGILLERTLRQLCQMRGLNSDGGIDALNNRLAAAGVYDKLIQKKIIVWGEIRNKATHGHFDKYTEQDVNELERWVASFIRVQGV